MPHSLAIDQELITSDADFDAKLWSKYANYIYFHADCLYDHGLSYKTESCAFSKFEKSEIECLKTLVDAEFSRIRQLDTEESTYKKVVFQVDEILNIQRHLSASAHDKARILVAKLMNTLGLCLREADIKFLSQKSEGTVFEEIVTFLKIYSDIKHFYLLGYRLSAYQASYLAKNLVVENFHRLKDVVYDRENPRTENFVGQEETEILATGIGFKSLSIEGEDSFELSKTFFRNLANNRNINQLILLGGKSLDEECCQLIAGNMAITTLSIGIRLNENLVGILSTSTSIKTLSITGTLIEGAPSAKKIISNTKLGHVIVKGTDWEASQIFDQHKRDKKGTFRVTINAKVLSSILQSFGPPTLKNPRTTTKPHLQTSPTGEQSEGKHEVFPDMPISTVYTLPPSLTQTKAQEEKETELPTAKATRVESLIMTQIYLGDLSYQPEGNNQQVPLDVPTAKADTREIVNNQKAPKIPVPLLKSLLFGLHPHSNGENQSETTKQIELSTEESTRAETLDTTRSCLRRLSSKPEGDNQQVSLDMLVDDSPTEVTTAYTPEITNNQRAPETPISLIKPSFFSRHPQLRDALIGIAIGGLVIGACCAAPAIAVAFAASTAIVSYVAIAAFLVAMAGFSILGLISSIRHTDHDIHPKESFSPSEGQRMNSVKPQQVSSATPLDLKATNLYCFSIFRSFFKRSIHLVKKAAEVDKTSSTESTGKDTEVSTTPSPQTAMSCQQ